jgi:thiamine-monophosphate kinase
VLSSDASVEEIHFRRAWTTWEIVGYRAVAVALSDLAAMASRPLGVLVSLVLPPELGEPVAAAIGRGIGDCLRDHGGYLLGGDVGASPGPVMVDVTAVGQAAAPVPRSGARPGDELWVTGHLGGAAAAVADLQRGLEPPPDARRRFERPTPRLKEASWLVERTSLHALIDLSDGLARDLRHLATVSGVGAEIELAAIPTIPSLQSFEGSDAALHLKVAGGEDYELLMAVESGGLAALAAPFAAAFGVPLTKIGSVVEAAQGVRWIGPDGTPRELEWGGFDHFHTVNEA